MGNATEPDDDNPVANADRIRKLINDWWQVVLSLTTTVAAVFAAFGVSEVSAKAAAVGVAVVTVAAATYFWRRGQRRAREQAKRTEALAAWKNQRPESAFRGLLSYGVGETLPGDIRRRRASNIAAQVLHADFRFGVISGDVGCGKSSLMDSGVGTLLTSTAECSVVLVRNPRQIFLEAGAASAEERLKAVRDLLMGTPRKAVPVLMIDQFEELLVAFPERADRQQLGAFLAKPIEGETVRVLCAVRSDYLLELHDLAPELPEPLATRSVFPVKNMTVPEATQVILECAAHDGVAIDEALAREIASDLSQSGAVRPPELQLVCAALADDPSVGRYRAAGGAKGILADYIRNALQIGPSPQQARALLRALCNFEASAPIKAEPVTPPELARMLELSKNTVKAVLVYLERAGLVVAHTDDGTTRYTLIHDYLVTPVNAATSDLSTRSERANQLLRLLISQAETDRSARIPLRKYDEIRRYASPELFRSPAVRRIVRRTLISTGIAAGMALCLAVCLAGGIYFAVQFKQTWQREVIGRHYPADLQETGVTYRVTSDGSGVWGGTFWGTPFVNLWNARTGKNEFSTEGRKSLILPGDQSVLVTSGESTVKAVFVGGGETVLPLSDLSNVTSNRSGKAIFSYSDDDRSGTSHVEVVSARDGTVIGDLDGVQIFDPDGTSTIRLDLTNSADVMIISAVTAGEYKPLLWRVAPKSVLADTVALADPAWTHTGYALSRDETKVVVWGTSKSGQLMVRTWGIDGTKLLTRAVDGMANMLSFDLDFTPNGSQIVIQGHDDDEFRRSKAKTVVVLSTADLLPVNTIPLGSTEVSVLGAGRGAFPYISWMDRNGGAVFWDVANDQLHRVSDLDLAKVQNATFDASGDALFSFLDRSMGIWNISKGTKIGSVNPPGPTIQMPGVTVDKSAFFSRLEGGSYYIYSSSTAEGIATIEDIGDLDEIYFDKNCDDLNIWTTEGLVVRYTKGYTLPFIGFWPGTKCSESP